MSVPVPAVDHEVPLFTECVLGYRAWSIDSQDRLWPISDRRTAWEPGINTARCNCAVSGTLSFDWSLRDGRRVLEPHPAHEAPSAECTCGLYSWRRPRPVWRDDEQFINAALVCGAVASWGRVQVHPTGFRAEHACVVTLAYPPEIGPTAKQKLARVAERYRVALVPLDRLEEEASRHGTPLPDSLGPEDDPGPVSGPEPHLSPELDEVGRAALLASRHPELEPIPLHDRIGLAALFCALSLEACGAPLFWLGRGRTGVIGMVLIGIGIVAAMLVFWWLDAQQLAGHAKRHARHHASKLRRGRRHPKPAMTDEEFEALEDALEPLEKYGSGLEGVTDPFRR